MVKIMDKQSLSEQLINEILNGLRSTQGFVVEQAPDVVKQILYWNLAVAAIWLAFALLLACFAELFFHRKLRKAILEEKGGYWDEGTWLFFWGTVTTYIVSVIIFMSNIFDAVKIYVAPKVYLIEYFSDLLRSRS